MGMVVRTNIQAVNANRQLGMNNSQVSKSLEKLASGFRINRAGDDASGLAISEKMKAQIKGLETASANSQDGISLIQTAEGALTEVHDMLNRMVELAGKSANGTMDDDVDRASLQKEMESLQVEIDRIAEGTNFNGKMLLNGSLDAGGAATGGAAGVPKVDFGELDPKDNAATKYSVAAFTPTTFGTSKLNMSTKDTLAVTVNYTDAKGNAQSMTIDLAYKASAEDSTKNVLVAADGTEYEAAAAGADVTSKQINAALAAEMKKDSKFNETFKVTYSSGDTMKIEAREAGANSKIDSALSSNVASTATAPDNKLTAVTATAGKDAYQSFDFLAATTNNDQYKLGDVFTVGGKKFAFVADDAALAKLDKDVKGVVLDSASGGVIANADVKNMAAAIEQVTGYKAEVDATVTTQLNFKAPTGTDATTGKGLTLQVGDTADAFNKVNVSIRNMSCAGIGISGISVADQDAASEAIKALKNTTGDNEFGAINIVSSVRADLGALQNKLEHTINNLDVAAENMTEANSRIRDTDMAKQMMEYTKSNVLTQAAQAMLAQANQQPQAVLQLLQ